MPIDYQELLGHLKMDKRRNVVQISSGRTVSVDDINSYLRTNGTSAFIVSIPTCANVPLAIGSWFTLKQAGTGQVTFVGESGVSILVQSSASLQTAKVGAVVEVIKVDSDTWDINYDVSAK